MSSNSSPSIRTWDQLNGETRTGKSSHRKVNELIESEVTELTNSTVYETALAILKRQGSRGITIVSSLRQINFDIQVVPYWPEWQTKRAKLGAKDFEFSEFHEDTWNRYLMLGFVSGHIPGDATSNVELRLSYKVLRDDLVRPSATTLNNICRREYALTVDAHKKHLPIWNKVCLALDGWTSSNKFAITSVIAYYLDQNWALSEVQLAFNEVDRLLCSCS